MIAYVALHGIIAAAVLVAFVRGRKHVLRVCGFLAPLGGLSLFLGVNFVWTKVIPLLLLAEVLLRGPGGRLRRFPALGLVLALLAWASGLSIWYAFVDGEAQRLVELGQSIGWGYWQTSGRYAVQFATFASTWLLAPLVYAAVRTPAERDILVKAFVAGNVVSIVAGLYQITAGALGLPWFDFAETGELARGNLGLREAQESFNIGPLRVLRLYGLGGEPKHTCALAVIALSLVLARTLRGERVSSPVVLALAAGIALTFSTSGWLSLVIVLAVAGALAMRGGDRALARNLRLIGGLLILATLVTSDAGAALVRERFVARFTDTAGGIGAYEFKDYALVLHVLASPFRLLAGHAPGGIDFFLIPIVDSRLLSENAMLTPTYGLTRLVGEVGVLGLVLAVGIFSRWRASLETLSAEGSAFLGLTMLALLAMPMVVLSSYLLLCGAFLSSSQRETGVRAPMRAAVAAMRA